MRPDRNAGKGTPNKKIQRTPQPARLMLDGPEIRCQAMGNAVSGNGNKVLKRSLGVRTDMRKFKGSNKKKIPYCRSLTPNMFGR
jgi:hypothetical protein